MANSKKEITIDLGNKNVKKKVPVIKDKSLRLFTMVFTEAKMFSSFILTKESILEMLTQSNKVKYKFKNKNELSLLIEELYSDESTLNITTNFITYISKKGSMVDITQTRYPKTNEDLIHIMNTCLSEFLKKKLE